MNGASPQPPLSVTGLDHGTARTLPPTVSQSWESLRVAVGIATRGRPSVLISTLHILKMQTHLPDRVLVCFAEDSDVGDAPAHFPDILFLRAEPGLTRQRNAILDQLSIEDVVLFLDDDFYIHPHYLGALLNVFAEYPDVLAATGTVLADGINGPGISGIQAHAILQSWRPCEATPSVKQVFNGYGCNMAVRLSTIRKHTLQFDVALPLYGWYEDVEFSRQLARYGKIVRIDAACGVHLGVKSGRHTGVRLGYSQVANPLYLAQRGRVSWLYALASMTSRTLKNVVRSFRPEPWVDRRGRLRGNLLGWSALISGTSHPTRILEL